MRESYIVSVVLYISIYMLKEKACSNTSKGIDYALFYRLILSYDMSILTFTKFVLIES